MSSYGCLCAFVTPKLKASSAEIDDLEGTRVTLCKTDLGDEDDRSDTSDDEEHDMPRIEYSSPLTSLQPYGIASWSSDFVARIWNIRHMKKCHVHSTYAWHIMGDPWNNMDDSLSPIIYKRMLPALRLAIIMLLHSQPFFMKIVCAQLVNLNGSAENPRWSLDPDYNPSEDDNDFFNQVVACMHTQMLWFFGKIPKSSPKPKNPHVLGYAVGKSYGDFDRVICQLNRCFLEHYSQPDFWKLDIAIHERADFTFATTLLHELAHMMRQICHALSRDLKMDPHRAHYAALKHPDEFLYHPSHPEVELGRAWEQSVFGCVLGLGGSAYPNAFLDFDAGWVVGKKWVELVKGLEAEVETEEYDDHLVDGCFDPATWQRLLGAESDTAQLEGGSVHIFSAIKQAHEERSKMLALHATLAEEAETTLERGLAESSPEDSNV